MSLTISPKVQFTRDALTWVAPAIGIPTLRYFQDDKAQRRELFVRDASTYTLGALLFLGTYFAGKRMMTHFPQLGNGARELIPFVTALAVNILYAGVGSVRLSKWFRASQPQETPPVNTPALGMTPANPFSALPAQPVTLMPGVVYGSVFHQTATVWPPSTLQGGIVANG